MNSAAPITLGLTPVETLTPSDVAEIKRLNDMTDREFDTQVVEYLHEVTDEDRRVFRSPALAARTFEALNRLVAFNEAAAQKIGSSKGDPDPRRRKEKRDRRQKLERLNSLAGAEKKVLKPALAAATTTEETESVRRRAAVAVAHALHPEEFVLAKRLIQFHGLSFPRVEQALKLIIIQGLREDDAVEMVRRQ